MENLTNPKVISTLMKKYGVRFSKKLGQNFIISPTVCPQMAELAGAGPDVGAIEIGPGIGVLTTELADRCKKVVAIELDEALLPILDETLADYDNVEIINADVLEVDLHAIIAEHFQGMDVIVCANLPYYITSPIVMSLLEQRVPVKSITVMVQKEAAQRICAPMPSRQMGAITVAVAYYAKPSVLFGVPPGSFMPAPDVDSSVIRLDMHSEPPVDLPTDGHEHFFRTVKALFAQRRKTVLNCLAAGFGLDKDSLRAVLEAANVPPTARAEQLTLQEFAAISRNLQSSPK